MRRIRSGYIPKGIINKITRNRPRKTALRHFVTLFLPSGKASSHPNLR